MRRPYPHPHTLPTLCAVTELFLTASIVCLAHSLLTPSPPTCPVPIAPTSKQPPPPRPPTVIAVLESPRVPANPPALWACSLSPPALCQFLSYLIRLPLPRAERLSAISNRQRELPQKSSVRRADGRSRPREAKACPRLSLLGVSNIPHRTPRPLYQPCPPTPELLPARDQALRSSATSGPVSLGWRWWNLSVRGWASEACRKVNICA